MSWLDILTIEAEADPVVTIRVSALVAVSNAIPAALTAIDLMNGKMQIVVELRNFDERKASYLARKIEGIPTVNSVHTARMWQRDRASAAIAGA